MAILWVFTCIFIFFWDKLPHIIILCASYTLYIIILMICIQNLLELYVKSHKNCHFWPFSLIFARFQPYLQNTGPNRSGPVLTGCGCGFPFLGQKTGPDRTSKHYQRLQKTAKTSLKRSSLLSLPFMVMVDQSQSSLRVKRSDQTRLLNTTHNLRVFPSCRQTYESKGHQNVKTWSM